VLGRPRGAVARVRSVDGDEKIGQGGPGLPFRKVGEKASQSDEIRAPVWGDIEKGKVKGSRVGGRPAMRQVFKSISWRRPTRRAHEELGTPNIT